MLNYLKDDLNLPNFLKKHLGFFAKTSERICLTDVWEALCKKHPTYILLNDDYSGIRITCERFYEKCIQFAAGLQALGIKKGLKVAQFAESSGRWILLDQAIIACGAINAVRGSLAPANELSYIYEHSDSCALIIDDMKVIDALSEHLNKRDTKFIIYIGNGDISGYKKLVDIPIFTFDDFDKFSKGKKYKKPEIFKNDPLTIVYSSGTTGKPKGVILSHGNIVSQISALHPLLGLKSGKSTISILPVWHMYGRTCTYYIMSRGVSINYTNLRYFKKDLQRYKPAYMVAVPRIWVAIYDTIMERLKEQPLINQWIFKGLLNTSKKCKKARRVLKNRCIYKQNPTFTQKITPFILSKVLAPIDKFSMKYIYTSAKDALGGDFLKGVSGGGALPHHVEDFFEALGITICVGYGLTETSPVLSIRSEDNNKVYSVGEALQGTEFKVVDPNTMQELPIGEKGLVLSRGPQIMLGYYKDKAATDAVILEDGWFLTGDLGWLTKDSHLVLNGRQKEIIVLQNGENVEAVALEDLCLHSTFVDQIVITGQDKISLTALISLNTNEVLRVLHKEENIDLNSCADFKAMLMNELNAKIKSRPSFRSYERLTNIYFVPEPFTIANGLMTQSLKIKKNQVTDKYTDKIDSMYRSVK